MVNQENLELLDGSIRNIKCAGRELKYQNQSYLPVYQKGDIIQCEFVGIGKELNFRHFAIVWCAKSNNENINIIPLTSKRKDESECQFNIGVVSGFYTKVNGELVSKESFVYLDKLMEVSRKRISPKFEQDADGNFIKNQYNRNKQLCLDAKMIKRIEEAFKIFYLGEGECLFDAISGIDIHYQIDSRSVTSDLLSVGYRMVYSKAIYNINNAIFLICNVAGKRYSIRFKLIGDQQRARHSSQIDKNLYHFTKWENNILNIRKQILKSLFSGNPIKVSEGKKILEKFWT